ncbi:MAG: hypothetical protein ACRCT8_10895 [Lacipirellulaceae bacterium]
MTPVTRTTPDAAATRSEALAALAQSPVGAYSSGGPVASEPTAWCAIALAEGGQRVASRVATEWLASIQAKDGSVGVTADQPDPAWPTALAILAWNAVDASGYRDRIGRAIDWALSQKPWTEERHRVFGHDTTLEGWSWAAHTHSWLEPTAFFVRALRAAGQADHPRMRQGVTLLVDRLLPSGGANYGNTVVLGQELLQHLQPSGVVLWALEGEAIEDARLGKSLDYVDRAVREPTGVASLCWGVLGLAAHGRDVTALEASVVEAFPRAERAGGVHKTALVALAAAAVVAQQDGTEP